MTTPKKTEWTFRKSDVIKHTWRLPPCLAWFCWLERARRAGGGARKAARDLCLSGRYRTTRRALFAVPRYDMGYWERRNAA